MYCKITYHLSCAGKAGYWLLARTQTGLVVWIVPSQLHMRFKVEILKDN